MENKYSEKTANVLLHLHDPDHSVEVEKAHSHTIHCPECHAPPKDIVCSDLPHHHPELTCYCLRCGYEWMPNEG